MTINSLLLQLLAIPAVASYEQILGISAFVTRQFKLLKPDQIITDQTGSVICFTKAVSGQPTVLISAHIDEVGFFITKKIGKFCYRILPLGDIDPKKAANTLTNLGIIKSEVKQPKSFNQLFLQSSLPEIDLLTPVYWAKQYKISRSQIIAPALDNKVGLTALLTLAKILKPIKYNLVFAGITQEEVGSKNYQRLVDQVKPDLVIDIDSAYASFKPNRSAINIPCISQGAAIQVIGSGLNYEKTWLLKIINLLNQGKIKFQLEIPLPTEGATLLSQVNLPGKFIQVNLPVANQHEARSIASVKDINSAIEIIIFLLGNKIL